MGIPAARLSRAFRAYDCGMVRLVCPRMSPEWELAAQLALVKPKPYTKSKIAHRDPKQPWPREARDVVETHLRGAAVDVSFPSAGDHHVAIDFGENDLRTTNRLARRISRGLPELWFAFDDGKTFMRSGVVYQRTGRYNLELVRANRMRLRRAVRFGFLGDLQHAATRPRRRTGENTPAE
jgi:hypothetical protein